MMSEPSPSPDRRASRRGPAPLRAVAHLGQARPGGPLRRRGPRGADPRPLAAEPMGPELAGAGRRGRGRPPAPGEAARVRRRAGRGALRLARVPEAPQDVLYAVGPVS